MSESIPSENQTKKDALEKLRPAAQILSNVELLVAMCEEQERAAEAASAPANTSEIEAAVETAVEKTVRAVVNDTVAKVVQTAVAEALSDSIDKALENCFSRFDKRIEQFDGRIDQFDGRINQIDEQLSKLDTNVQSFNTRFDSLDEKIDSAAPPSDSNNAATELQLSSQLDVIGSDLAGVVAKFESKFASLERTFQDQCKTVNGFYAKISTADAPKTQATVSTETETSAEPLAAEKEVLSAADAVASDWQKQKDAMLAKYGGDPEQQSSDQTPAAAESEKSTSDSNTDLNEAATDSDEIEKIKQQLNEKLREAEVELSINRARLSQERAEFEREQADLERRSSKLEAKLAAMNTDAGDGDDGGDIMDRFKRHLGS